MSVSVSSPSPNIAGRATETSFRSCAAPTGSFTGPTPSTDNVTPAAGPDVSALNDPVVSLPLSNRAIFSRAGLTTTDNLQTPSEQVVAIRALYDPVASSTRKCVR